MQKPLRSCRTRAVIKACIHVQEGLTEHGPFVRSHSAEARPRAIKAQKKKQFNQAQNPVTRHDITTWFPAPRLSTSQSITGASCSSIVNRGSVVSSYGTKRRTCRCFPKRATPIPGQNDMVRRTNICPALPLGLCWSIATATGFSKESNIKSSYGQYLVQRFKAIIYFFYFFFFFQDICYFHE